MSELESLRERIETMEMRIAYQDDTIETLNATITSQWKQIDMLTRQMAAIGERLAEAETAVGTPSNERPPHY
ncbi:MAG: SlyX family protein [Bradyrhizobiaceae bacterium]|nr:MAG: SlyX family protein [Bradyrhizobiaceae bacterium]